MGEPDLVQREACNGGEEAETSSCQLRLSLMMQETLAS